ncbi:MAG: DUF503 domain-containing protein [Myxococcota bacterium]|nr:DUF503 domain-containing protein [Myxococcota bacterium]
MLRLQLHIPGSRSLKDKRRAVAQVRDRLRSRHNLSVAEVGHLEDHRRAVLTGAMVANDSRFLRSALDSIAHEVGGWRPADLEAVDIHLMRPHDAPDPGHYDGETDA